MDADEERVKPDDGSELEPRPHAVDIYERVCDDTVEELRRPPSSLAFSGVFAGFTIALAPLAYALALVDARRRRLGEVRRRAALSARLHRGDHRPGAVLHREHPLPGDGLDAKARVPAASRRGSGAIVYATNLLGAFLFAMLAIFTGRLRRPVQANLVAEGVGDTSGPLTPTFWSAVVTGWLLALVAWLVEAVRARDRPDRGDLRDHAARRPRRLRPLHRDHGRGVHARCSRARSRSATCSAGSR